MRKEVGKMDYKFLLDIAIILASTKILGLFTKKVNMPQVVGALLAGVILGPACVGVLTETDMIQNMAELGVIVLMFCAGMETDIEELKRSGKASFVIALLGVIVPLVVGGGVAYLFINNGYIVHQMLQVQYFYSQYLLCNFTATSVSITVETLKELCK